MVNPSERGQWRAAERWVNGSLLRDDSFKAYARAVTEFGEDTPEALQYFATQWEDDLFKLGPL